MADDRKEKVHFDAFMRHVMRTAPTAEPPPTFAGEMARRVATHAEEAKTESLVTRVVLVVAAIATGGFSVPFLVLATAHIQEFLGNAPWPLLLVAAAVFCGMKLLEVVPLQTRRSRYGQG